MIHEKLFNVQQALKAPKDQVNNFGNYKYRSCEQVLEALKPLLKENKMTVILSDTVKEIGGRVYIEATATAVDIENGESVFVTASAREEESKKGMDSSQISGAASSYARKYALSGLFAIDDNKDSDATNNGNEKPVDNSPREKSTETPKQVTSENDKVAKLTKHDNEGYYIECADCGKKMRDQPRKDGTVYYVQDYAAACLRTYGRPICKTCRSKNGEGQTA